jgi:hypothetical protein
MRIGTKVRATISKLVDQHLVHLDAAAQVS